MSTAAISSNRETRTATRTRGLAERLLMSEYLVLALTAAYFLAMWPIVPSIATRETLLDVLAAMMPLLVVAIGQTFVLIVAGIDLSAPSIMAAASVVGASMMTGEGGFVATSSLAIPIGIAAFVAVGLLIGLFNGVCTTRLGMPPFIVTLTTMMFFSGFALFYTAALTDDGSSFGDLPSQFVAIGQGTVAGVPYSLGVAAVVMGVAHLVLSRTVFGRWLYAIGRNPRAAAISGVPVRRAVMGAFIISGLCAAIASVLYTGRLETGTPVLGQRILLDIVGSAVNGGVSRCAGPPCRGQGFAVAGAGARLRVRDQGRGDPACRGAGRAAAPVDSPRMTTTDDVAPFFMAQGLSKSFFGVRVLHDMSFSLRAGQVLGLVGENGSGKSTTMNILGGVLPMDAGRMPIDGVEYQPSGPRTAEARGIAFIHQELNLFRNLTVAENLFIAGFPRRFRGLPFIDWARVRARTQELLAAVDLDVPPNTPVSRLSQGERQLVEIAKALGGNARMIIFDEPTTSLTTRETERLFDIIGRLRRQGIGIIYISHILGDVLSLCDDVVGLRDGHKVGGAARAEMTVERMISLMVGRTIDQIYPPREPQPELGPPVMEVRGLSQRGMIKDIGLTLRAGEVLGVSGLMGAGRSELARILFGLDPRESGEVRVRGNALARLSPALCMAEGMAFLTEDRRAEGLMMEASIADNIALASLPGFGRTWMRFIDRTRLGDEVGRAAAAVRIAAPDLQRTLVKNLSGGNQQKAVIAKWLLHQPRVFILDEPTRGIDVGAKYEVYKIINQLAADGTGILFISSEIEELTGMCDRILVMAHGEIRAEFTRERFDREAILRAAMWHGIKEVA